MNTGLDPEALEKAAAEAERRYQRKRRIERAAPEMLELLRECAECLPRHTPIWADVHTLVARVEAQS